MGYRSDVKYLIAFKTEEDRTKFLGEAELTVADHSDQSVRDIPSAYRLTTYEGNSKPFIIQVHYEDVKWYDDFPCVRMEIELMNMAEETYDADFEFLRIGENDDDIDRRSSADTYIGDYIDYRRYSEFC